MTASSSGPEGSDPLARAREVAREAVAPFVDYANDKPAADRAVAALAAAGLLRDQPGPKTLDQLAAEQGVTPIKNAAELVSKFADELSDEEKGAFLAAVSEGRDQPAETEYAYGAMINGEMKYRKAPRANVQLVVDAMRSNGEESAHMAQREVGPWRPVEDQVNETNETGSTDG